MRQKTDIQTILAGAYRVVLKKGLNGLTARAVAQESSISTQPIYLVFQNMDELRETLITQLFSLMEKEYFRENQTPAQFSLNYYRFVRDHTGVYFSLLLERREIRNRLDELLKQLFLESLPLNSQKKLSEEEARFILSRMTGLMMGLGEMKTFRSSSQKIERLVEKSIQQDLELLLHNRLV